MTSISEKAFFSPPLSDVSDATARCVKSSRFSVYHPVSYCVNYQQEKKEKPARGSEIITKVDAAPLSNNFITVIDSLALSEI